MRVRLPTPPERGAGVSISRRSSTRCSYRRRPTFGKKVDVEEKELYCPGCKKKRYVRNGWYCGKHEKRQRYKCVICGRRFRDNLGFEYR